MMNNDYVSFLHGYRDTRPESYRDDEFDIFVSHDVIGHVTVGFAYSECPTYSQTRSGSDASLLRYIHLKCRTQETS